MPTVIRETSYARTCPARGRPAGRSVGRPALVCASLVAILLLLFVEMAVEDVPVCRSSGISRLLFLSSTLEEAHRNRHRAVTLPRLPLRRLSFLRRVYSPTEILMIPH